MHKMLFAPPVPKEQDNAEALEIARRQADTLDRISEFTRQSAQNSKGPIRGGAK